jgi:hypothetical protein
VVLLLLCLQVSSLSLKHTQITITDHKKTLSSYYKNKRKTPAFNLRYRLHYMVLPSQSLKPKKLNFDAVLLAPFLYNSHKIFHLWVACVSQHAQNVP